MNAPRDYLTKWSKPGKDKYHMISLIDGIYKKKKIHMNFFTEQKETHRHRKQTWIAKVGSWGKDGLGV